MKIDTELYMNKQGTIMRGGFEYSSYDGEFTPYILDIVKDYPDAYDALTCVFKSSVMNTHEYQYRITHQFLCCKCGELDYDSCDLGADGNFNSEHVQCAIRKYCPYSRRVCEAKRSTTITPAEMEVLRLWHDGKTEQQIADILGKKHHTVHAQIRSAYARMGVNSKALFFKHALEKDLFKD